MAPVKSCLPGTSPRTRGTLGQDALRHGQWRYIPAHAGNSMVLRPAALSMSVHPRARGELSSQSFTLVRVCRYIPAHAGNSVALRYIAGQPSVHPRARGELFEGEYQPIANGGTSPRTRGTRVPHLGAEEERRYIPAHAGNSLAEEPGPVHQPVHPRARGELVRLAARFPRYVGTSPRTRGTLSGAPPRGDRARYIPAHAGNSVSWLASRADPTVHPRARGELRPSTSFRPSASGTSPRTRGTRILSR